MADSTIKKLECYEFTYDGVQYYFIGGEYFRRYGYTLEEEMGIDEYDDWHNEFTKQMDEIKDYSNVIIPLRNPRDVAKSWAKRKKDYGWDFMYQQLPDIKGHRFYIDDGDRALKLLNRRLRKKLKTDWEPLNHVEGKWDDKPIVNEAQIQSAERVYQRMRG